MAAIRHRAQLAAEDGGESKDSTSMLPIQDNLNT
jgi:hypothetical protein